jgi:hypothetical protein
VIGLSTVLGPDNYFSKLFTDCDPEVDEIFIKLKGDLYCAACGDDPEKLKNCHCNDWKHPNWNLPQNARIAQMFMSSTAMYGREVLGAIMADRTDCCFRKKWLDDLFKRRAPYEQKGGEYMFTFVDTAGGGDSEWAAITIIRRHGHLFIAGVMAFRSEDLSMTLNNFQHYFTSFEHIPEFTPLEHVFVVERNYSGSDMTQMFSQEIKKRSPALHEYKPDPQKFGAWTDHNSKQTGVQTLVNYFEANNVSFCQNMGGLSTLRTNMEEFHRQLCRYHMEKLPSGEFAFTGKGKAGERDDMACGLTLCLVNASKCGVATILRAQAQGGVV